MVGCSDKEAAAKDIAKSDWNKVAEQPKPVVITRGKKAGRKIVHVGNGVFKAADDKQHDWKDDAKNFAGSTFGGSS